MARRSPSPALISGVAAAALLVLAGLLAISRLAPPSASRPAGPAAAPEQAGPPPAGAPQAGDAPLAAAAPGQQAVADDGRLLWAAPSAGAPLHLGYTPPGAQLFLALRPGELLASPEGRRLFDAVGPELQQGRRRWEAAAGVPLSDVRQLLVAWRSQSGGPPQATAVVRLLRPRPRAELATAWDAAAPRELPGGLSYGGPQHTFLAPAAGEVEWFVMGDPTAIGEIAERRGAPPPLRRDVERLRSASDDRRQVILLGAPAFLFSDGRPLLAGPRQPCLDLLDGWLGRDLNAAALSLQLGETAYLEVRWVCGAGQNPLQGAQQFRDRLAAAPQRIAQQLAAAPAPPYWRPVAQRLPEMVRFLHRYTRVGVEDGQVIANAVLPAQAPHNLVFGAEMLLLHSSGAPPPAAAAALAQPPASMAELLQRTTTLAFDQLSLEQAVQQLVEGVCEDYPGLSFRFGVTIRGEDLQREGITRNQQIRAFRQQQVAIADVLTALVAAANPVTTVRDFSDPDQKLVWVVGADATSPASEVVWITTRNAARGSGWVLPRPFRTGSD